MSNTIYYAAELMVYFEKTRFFDIVKALLVALAKERPLCLKHYLRRNLRKIANSVLTSNTIIHLPPGVDENHFANAMFKINNIPIITCNKKIQNIDKKQFGRILRHFEKFCHKHGIQKKNKIFLNCPRNFEEVLQIEKCGITPANFINITASAQVEEGFKQVLDYYRPITKQVSALNFEDPNDLASEVLYKIKYSPISRPYSVGGNYVYRLVILGRRGSGRKTQAKMIAARYNSVYIDLGSLVDQTFESKDNMSKVLSIAFQKQKQFSSTAVTALVWKRLLQSDTLSRGWVIVGFPNFQSELETLVEKFQTPPNRFVIIHCNKMIALRRLVKQWERSQSGITYRNTTSFVENEFTQYDQNIKNMYTYLKSKNVKTIHVDGKRSSISVKNKIFSLLQR